MPEKTLAFIDNHDRFLATGLTGDSGKQVGFSLQRSKT
jgi:hypothetical protein